AAGGLFPVTQAGVKNTDARLTLVHALLFGHRYPSFRQIARQLTHHARTENKISQIYSSSVIIITIYCINGAYPRGKEQNGHGFLSVRDVSRGRRERQLFRRRQDRPPDTTRRQPNRPQT